MHHVTLSGTQLSDVLLRLGDHERHVSALASATSKGWGNLLAWNPVAIFQDQTENRAKDTVSQLEKFVEEQQKLRRQVIGYVSYDFGCLLQDVSIKADDDIGIPLVMAASFDSWLVFRNDAAEVHTTDPLYVNKVKEILQRPARKVSANAYKKALKPTLSRVAYNQAYKRVKDYIQAGDVYQINLTHRLEGATDASGRDLFCMLSETSQVDFRAYIETDDFEILSFSPERFIRVNGRVIETSPIKGTRPRSADVSEDEALRADLLTNPKDCAELNMITDLMRNDLGAICDVGSVAVTEERVITGYPTLWHAHATIQGKLSPEISPIAALANAFPGGSITGCPKKRAMEVISELEIRRRNIYTGSIFTVGPDGELDSSIAIRTMLKEADHLYLSVGGGIVYDSTEEDEYQESLDKARSFMRNNNEE
jgi:para-aminobenzoate synthetase component 1